MNIDLAKYERQVADAKSLLKEVDTFVRFVECEIVVGESVREYREDVQLIPKFPESTLCYE